VNKSPSVIGEKRSARALRVGGAILKKLVLLSHPHLPKNTWNCSSC